jgi:peroxiredoxin
VQGVIRSTFLVNKSWEILQEYRNIRAKWHAERLLKELKDV